MALADFSKMFMEVDDEEIPHSLKFLLDVVGTKRVDALSLADNHMTPESCQLIADLVFTINPSHMHCMPYFTGPEESPGFSKE